MKDKPPTKRPRGTPSARLVGRIIAVFMQGLIAVLPLTVTIVIVTWLGLTTERTLGRAIEWALPKGWYMRGMGIAAAVAAVFLAGVLMNIYGVPKLLQWGEKVIGRIPFVKTVYGAVRDLLGFFSQPGGDRDGSMICRTGWVEKAMLSCSFRTATKSGASR